MYFGSFLEAFLNSSSSMKMRIQVDSWMIRMSRSRQKKFWMKLPLLSTETTGGIC
jgi:hypothetical protein